MGNVAQRQYMRPSTELSAALARVVELENELQITRESSGKAELGLSDGISIVTS